MKKNIKEDIEDLKFLIRKYLKENNFKKASECQKELDKIKK